MHDTIAYLRVRLRTMPAEYDDEPEVIEKVDELIGRNGYETEGIVIGILATSANTTSIAKHAVRHRKQLRALGNPRGRERHGMRKSKP
uniref:Uncharacterized protein n=1 Tax=Coccidioides posadasii RMSCC 3488 TaxID=454284 RepID=A0A0J6F9U8_COCPO|nr:hypothetical protein CPAG_06119 [Coccidioides posadasii RMSCC 3488]